MPINKTGAEPRIPQIPVPVCTFTLLTSCSSGCPELLWGVQHKQKKTQIMESAAVVRFSKAKSWILNLGHNSLLHGTF